METAETTKYKPVFFDSIVIGGWAYRLKSIDSRYESPFGFYGPFETRQEAEADYAARLEERRF